MITFPMIFSTYFCIGLIHGAVSLRRTNKLIEKFERQEEISQRDIDTLKLLEKINNRIGGISTVVCVLILFGLVWIIADIVEIYAKSTTKKLSQSER